MIQCFRKWLPLSLVMLPFLASGQGAYDRTQVASYFQNQEFERAINYLHSLTQQPGNELQIQADIGFAYFMNEEPKQAKDAFLIVYQQHPDNLQANLYLAQSYGLLDKPDSSIGFYINLTRLQPANWRYWYRASLLFQEMTAYDSALLYIKRAFAINPQSGRLLITYANLLTRLKQGNNVEPLVDGFLAIDPDNEEVVARKIDISFRKPNYAEVMRWGEKLWRDSSELVAPMVSLAYSLLNTDSLDRCLLLCHWMMDNNRATQSILYCAALAYSRKKEFVKSNELLDECLKISLQKEAVSFFNAKADNFEAMKKYRMAANYYDTSYYIFHTPLDLYYGGRIFDKYLRDSSSARKYYRRYLQRHKDSTILGQGKLVQYAREYLKEN